MRGAFITIILKIELHSVRNYHIMHSGNYAWLYIYYKHVVLIIDIIVNVSL